MEEGSHSLVLAIGKLRAEQISESIYVSACRVMPRPVLTKVSHKSEPIRDVAGEFLRCTLKIEVVREIDGGKRNDGDRKSTRLNSSHGYISYAVFCLKKKNTRRCGGQTRR